MLSTSPRIKKSTSTYIPSKRGVVTKFFLEPDNKNVLEVPMLRLAVMNSVRDGPGSTCSTATALTPNSMERNDVKWRHILHYLRSYGFCNMIKRNEDKELYIKILEIIIQACLRIETFNTENSVGGITKEYILCKCTRFVRRIMIMNIDMKNIDPKNIFKHDNNGTYIFTSFCKDFSPFACKVTDIVSKYLSDNTIHTVCSLFTDFKKNNLQIKEQYYEICETFTLRLIKFFKKELIKMFSVVKIIQSLCSKVTLQLLRKNINIEGECSLACKNIIVNLLFTRLIFPIILSPSSENKNIKKSTSSPTLKVYSSYTRNRVRTATCQFVKNLVSNEKYGNFSQYSFLNPLIEKYHPILKTWLFNILSVKIKVIKKVKNQTPYIGTKNWKKALLSLTEWIKENNDIKNDTKSQEFVECCLKFCM